MCKFFYTANPMRSAVQSIIILSLTNLFIRMLHCFCCEISKTSIATSQCQFGMNIIIAQTSKRNQGNLAPLDYGFDVPTTVSLCSITVDHYRACYFVIQENCFGNVNKSTTKRPSPRVDGKCKITKVLRSTWYNTGSSSGL